MEAREGLLALSTALSEAQVMINDIHRFGYAGHRDDLTQKLAKVFSAICYLDHLEEVKLSEIHQWMETKIAEHYCEFSDKHNTIIPERIRTTFKVVK